MMNTNDFPNGDLFEDKWENCSKTNWEERITSIKDWWFLENKNYRYRKIFWGK